tara:strand:- start:130 stop:453 length:324 start_codon:yes stop_codon:yes gene_type:complete
MHSERMSKLEMRIGGAAGKVIAECPAVDIDKMVSLVEEFREIRCEDMMWKTCEHTHTLPAFDAFDRTLASSGIAVAETFDIFDRCEVWSVMPSGDAVRACLVWHKGF